MAWLRPRLRCPARRHLVIVIAGIPWEVGLGEI